MKDSGHAVVKQTEDKEEIVKAGKDNKEVVKRVLHILRGENVDGEGVAEKSEDCNRDLKKIKILREYIHLYYLYLYYYYFIDCLIEIICSEYRMNQ